MLTNTVPCFRILRETGRTSATPYYSVAFYSNDIYLGEGWGTALDMAEHRVRPQRALVSL